MKLLFT